MAVELQEEGHGLKRVGRGAQAETGGALPGRKEIRRSAAAASAVVLR